MDGSHFDHGRAATGLRDRFRRWGDMTANVIGTPAAFFAALASIFIWAFCGPLFNYSDTWQLIINTATTIITFLIVFLIQNTQNRDTRILNLKLDELLRAGEGARTGFCGLDQYSEAELEELQADFTRLAARFGGLIADDLDDVRRELSTRRKRPAP